MMIYCPYCGNKIEIFKKESWNSYYRCISCYKEFEEIQIDKMSGAFEDFLINVYRDKIFKF